MSKIDNNKAPENKRSSDNDALLSSLLGGGKQGKSKVDKLYTDFYQKSNKTVEDIEISSLFPAPDDLNFFPEISDTKMLEMIFSIQENGLFNPIIVWEQDNGYMILSGHNRVTAYGRIVSEYSHVDSFDSDKYKTIPAIVYGKNEIDEEKAKEIIVDTNYIQRDDYKRLLPEIIKNRINIIKDRKDIKGRTIDIVAKELMISSTKVYEDQLIANKIIPELRELYFEGVINKKPILRFAWFSKDIQKKLYKGVDSSNFTDDKVYKIKKDMTYEEIYETLTSTDYEKKVAVQLRVPEKLKDDFRKMANEWIKNNSSN